MEPMSEIAMLGAIQGLTEFLPVSSDGHLAVGQAVLGIDEGNLALSVFLHAGTLLATLLYFRRHVAELILAVPRALDSSQWTHPGPVRDILLILCASLPTAIIGFTLKSQVETWTQSPVAVTVGFVVTGIFLVSTAFAPPTHRDDLALGLALLVGLAQGLAVAPGISRSGSTIALLLWLGVRQGRAFELSMLISLPAVLGALILEVPKALAGSMPASVLVAGAAVAFGVGLAALSMLKRLVVAGKFAWFAAWVFPMALVVWVTRESWPEPNAAAVLSAPTALVSVTSP